MSPNLGFNASRTLREGNVSVGVSIPSLQASLTLAACCSDFCRSKKKKFQGKLSNRCPSTKTGSVLASVPACTCAFAPGAKLQLPPPPNYGILVWQDSDCWLTSPGFVGQECAHINSPMYSIVSLWIQASAAAMNNQPEQKTGVCCSKEEGCALQGGGGWWW